MNARLFWKSLAVQTVVVAIPFALLDLALDRFVLRGLGLGGGAGGLAGLPVVTARILRLPLGYVLFSALAGGVAGRW